MTILVIVESPTKQKTIEKILGKNYIVRASYGHFRDLPKKEIGIDLETFEPTFVLDPKKSKNTRYLKDLAKNSEEVILATDDDREGEAIAYHLAKLLKLDIQTNKRIIFHEITKKAIQNAVENPGTINMNIVNAQIGRRLLDRITGYKLSPLLCKKIGSGLSAGRVQSVINRFICEKEDEINNFEPDNYFEVNGKFKNITNKKCKTIYAKCSKKFKDKKSTLSYLNKCIESEFEVKQIEENKKQRNPPPPFITSTLQQDASSKFHFNTKKTMKIAQQLYEKGLITYHRTDSTLLSNDALQFIKTSVINKFGDKYYKFRQYGKKVNGSQNAHECIRHTNFNKDLQSYSQTLSSDEYKLFGLIYKRTLASQMASADINETVITICVSKSKYPFIAKGEVIVFDGFLIIYGTDIKKNNNNKEDKQNSKNVFSEETIDIGDKLNHNEIKAEETYDSPPPRFTEGTLVKYCEKNGVGRPSTYATIISNVIDKRGYAEIKNLNGEEKKISVITLNKSNEINESEKDVIIGKAKYKIVATDLGKVVNEFLTKNFENMIDKEFTKNMEEKLDNISNGGIKQKDMLNEFYKLFKQELEVAQKKAVDEKSKTTFQIHKSKYEPIKLGLNKNNEEVSIHNGKFGYYIKIGEANKKLPAKYVSKVKDLTIDDINSMVFYPLKVSTIEDKDVTLNSGRYGLYLRYDNKNYKIDKKLYSKFEKNTFDKDDVNNIINK